MMQRVRMWVAVVFVALLTVAGTAMAQVDCDAGATLAEAVASANPGDTIQVSGTCNESITITTDRLTLDGQGSAVIDGGGGGGPGAISQGVITISGVQGVVVTGFTVQNGPSDGINVQKGGAATIQNTTVQDSADDGIEVTEGSTAELIDCTVLRSGEFGISSVRNSSVNSRGAVISNENASYGFLVFTSSALNIAEGTLQTDMNGLDGILVGSASAINLTALGAPSTTSNNNARDGISVFNGGSLNAGGGMITATMNGRDGMRIGVTSSIQGRVSMAGNTGPGLIVDSAGVTIIGATIENNGSPDVNLTFGARAFFANSTIAGTISCDGTELIQGAACSPSP